MVTAHGRQSDGRSGVGVCYRANLPTERQRVRSRSKEALEAGELTPQLLDVMETPSVKFAHRAEYVGLAVVLTLMVVKPF